MQTLTTSISQKVFALPKLPRISLRWIWAIGVLLVVFLLVFYIIQVNWLTETNSSILSYKKQVDSLTQENQDLEMNFSQTGSLANLESLLKSLNYVKVDKIHYIQVLEGQMAAK